MLVGAAPSQVQSIEVTLAGGRGSLVFAVPGAGNTRFIDAMSSLGAHWPWLLFDWNGDGAHSGDATTRPGFGTFPGRDEFIYALEPWD